MGAVKQHLDDKFDKMAHTLRNAIEKCSYDDAYDLLWEYWGDGHDVWEVEKLVKSMIEADKLAIPE
jgi:hypothetical protein